MQRTLLELGFLPTAYVPAMVFSEVERLDIVRMVRLFVPPEFSAGSLERTRSGLADAVLKPFVSQQVLPEIKRVVSELPLFRGLEPEQVQRLASACGMARFSPGESILEEGGLEPTLFILITGEADIRRDGARQRVGVVRTGECLGEMSLLTGQPHSASALAARDTEAATLSHRDLMELIRVRPDIGLVMFRNLATGLGAKLGRAAGESQVAAHG